MVPDGESEPCKSGGREIWKSKSNFSFSSVCASVLYVLHDQMFITVTSSNG